MLFLLLIFSTAPSQRARCCVCSFLSLSRSTPWYVRSQFLILFSRPSLPSHGSSGPGRLRALVISLPWLDRCTNPCWIRSFKPWHSCSVKRWLPPHPKQVRWPCPRVPCWPRTSCCGRLKAVESCGYWELCGCWESCEIKGALVLFCQSLYLSVGLYPCAGLWTAAWFSSVINLTGSILIRSRNGIDCVTVVSSTLFNLRLFSWFTISSISWSIDTGSTWALSCIPDLTGSRSLPSLWRSSFLSSGSVSWLTWRVLAVSFGWKIIGGRRVASLLMTGCWLQNCLTS